MPKAVSARRPKRGEPAAAPAFDILVESRRWSALPRARATVRKALERAADATSTAGAGVAIVLTHDSAIRRLNRQWRGFDKPTNVLSFPAPAPAGAVGRFLGDIVIAYETTAREARAERKPLAHHLSHLAVHGYLHLVGYDHETDRDASRMERLETRILATLDVPDPYAGRPVEG